MSAPGVSQWIDEDGDGDTKSLVVVLLIWTVWFLITYVGLIIILNFLIALISQSYEEVMTSRKKYLYSSRADLNKKFIFLKGVITGNMDTFNVIMLSYEKEGESESGDEWQGFIQTIRTSIKKFNDNMAKKLLNELNKNHQEISSVNSLLRKVSELNVKNDNALSDVKKEMREMKSEIKENQDKVKNM